MDKDTYFQVLWLSSKSRLFIVAEIVEAGHQFHPGWCTEGLGYTVAHNRAHICHLLQVGGLIGGPAVHAEALRTHIVGHDQDHIGLLVAGDQGQSQDDWDKHYRTVSHNILVL